MHVEAAAPKKPSQHDFAATQLRFDHYSSDNLILIMLNIQISQPSYTSVRYILVRLLQKKNA